MEVMGLHLSQLRRLAPLFPNNDQLKSFMVDIFHIMFDFCKKSRHVFVKASERTSKNHLRAITPVGLSTLIKLVWKPFKIEFGEIRTRLSEVIAKIEFEINLAEKEEAHAGRTRAAQERTVQTSRWEEAEQFQKRWQSEVEDSEMEKITKSLAPANVLSNHTNFLQAAAFYGYKDIVHILADAGVDVNMEGGVRGTALVSAASAGDVEMVKLLV